MNPHLVRYLYSVTPDRNHQHLLGRAGVVLVLGFINVSDLDGGRSQLLELYREIISQNRDSSLLPLIGSGHRLQHRDALLPKWKKI